MSEINRLAYEVAAKDSVWPVLPIIMADTETGEILYVSRFAAAIFGYETTELMGKPIESLVPDDVKTAHAVWRQDVSVPRTRLMGAGRQLFGRRKDGALFPVHIGLTEMTVSDRSIGVAFVIDLTGIVRMPSALDSGSFPAVKSVTPAPVQGDGAIPQPPASPSESRGE